MKRSKRQYDLSVVVKYRAEKCALAILYYCNVVLMICVDVRILCEERAVLLSLFLLANEVGIGTVAISLV